MCIGKKYGVEADKLDPLRDPKNGPIKREAQQFALLPAFKILCFSLDNLRG